MCYAVKCLNCSKTTWAGCGRHIESVKSGVPPAEWCSCSASERKPEAGSCAML